MLDRAVQSPQRGDGGGFGGGAGGALSNGHANGHANGAGGGGGAYAAAPPVAVHDISTGASGQSAVLEPRNPRRGLLG